MKKSLRDLFRRVHQNEEGAVSLETILIVGAIALPILIFLIRYGWPKIKGIFMQGVSDLESAGEDVKQGNDPTIPTGDAGG